MIAEALLAMVFRAAVPADLLARSDDLNLAYTQCLFATVREANAVRMPVPEFERKLARSCLAEERAQRAVGIRILQLRGHAAPAQEVDSLNRDIRRDMVEQYRKLPEQERLLRQINELCAARPEECR